MEGDWAKIKRILEEVDRLAERLNLKVTCPAKYAP